MIHCHTGMTCVSLCRTGFCSLALIGWTVFQEIILCYDILCPWARLLFSVPGRLGSHTGDILQSWGLLNRGTGSSFRCIILLPCGVWVCNVKTSFALLPPGFLFRGCTFGGVYVPCIYSHARWIYHRQFSSLWSCSLSIERYYFPLLVLESLAVVQMLSPSLMEFVFVHYCLHFIVGLKSVITVISMNFACFRKRSWCQYICIVFLLLFFVVVIVVAYYVCLIYWHTRWWWQACASVECGEGIVRHRRACCNEGRAQQQHLLPGH